MSVTDGLTEINSFSKVFRFVDVHIKSVRIFLSYDVVFVCWWSCSHFAALKIKRVKMNDVF